jgi:hypothetical protein
MEVKFTQKKVYFLNRKQKMTHTMQRQLMDSRTGTIPNTMPHRATRALEVPFRGTYERSRPSLLFSKFYLQNQNKQRIML